MINHMPSSTAIFEGANIMKKTISISMICLPLCLLTWTLGAQDRTDDGIDALLDFARDDDALAALLKAKTIRCSLGKGCTADWTKGDPNLTVDKWREKPEDCIMIFDSIDLRNGTARFVGALGSVDARVTASPQGITFIERTPSGNLAITTIFASYKKDTKNHIFVHSRHLNMGVAPLPSQYHGTCKTLE